MSYAAVAGVSSQFTRRPRPAPAPAPAPGGDLIPALAVEYVDASGVRHRTNVAADGSTSISGVAPMYLHLDATGTRAVTSWASYSGGASIYTPTSYPASADRNAIAEQVYNYLAVGYRFNYGGSISGTWAYPEGFNDPKNDELGHPITDTVVENAGTHTIRLKVRDEAGREATIQFTVVASAPGAATNITTGGGGWPNWASGTRYTLNAGADYSSYGTLDTGGRHNIIIEKTGAGADPIVSGWTPDGRSKFGETVEFAPRARHIRLVNINVTTFSEGQRGSDLCCMIGGRAGRYNSSGIENLFSEGSSAVQSVARYTNCAGFFGTHLQNLNDTSGGYVMFGTLRGLAIKGCLVEAVQNGTTTWAMMRIYGEHLTWRNSKFRISATQTSSNGIPISNLSMNGTGETLWRADDRPAAVGSSVREGTINRFSGAYRCQFWDATSNLTNALYSTGGNPTAVQSVHPFLGGMEDCVYHPSGDIAITLQTGNLGGRAMYWRNNRKAMGSGDYVPLASTFDPNASGGNGNTNWNGAYLGESANTRPVPTAF